MTKTSITRLASETENLTAAEFITKYENNIELLDVDNMLDYNEGVVNIVFHGRKSEISMLFVDGVLDTIC
jgi:hypothetical protein